MENFKAPYLSKGFSEFWRRWHISLSSWLRDYLYVPLGGNRGTRWQTYRNLVITMLLGGLWHGAAWGFVVWGALHGAYLVVERWMSRDRKGATGSVSLPVLLVFGIVTLTWIPFGRRIWPKRGMWSKPCSVPWRGANSSPPHSWWV